MIFFLVRFAIQPTSTQGAVFPLGFHFPQNFDSPYKAVNPSDFWRRWHMTLSGWLRDYLFIPLGGSRGGTWLTVRNLMITFLLGGLWHGAAWTFVAWGLLWGFYQSVHVVAKKYGLAPKWVWLNRILTFLAATVAWYLEHRTWWERVKSGAYWEYIREQYGG